MNSFNIYHRRWHKFNFYLTHVWLDILPKNLLCKSYEEILAKFEKLSKQQQDYICHAVSYYNRLEHPFSVNNPKGIIGNFPRQKPSSYYYDLANLLRYFPSYYKFDYLFGDITSIADKPSFVKSRPIATNNANSILLKLDSVRHFYVLPDKQPFHKKKPLLVWRGAAHQPHRLNFLENYHHIKNFDVGCVHQKSYGKPYHRPYLSIAEQQRYKYILSIEGNDVATNLKWIMYSNSLCFMTQPKYETWLMEGALQPNVHYVLVREDYADLAEKIDYYERYPQEAKAIIAQAQEWMQPFMNEEMQLMIGLFCMKKYFQLSGQLS